MVKTNTIRRDAKGWRLSDIMQERAPGQCRWAGMRQFLQQQERVDEDVAFRMKLRRLLHPLHRRNLWQNLMEQTGFIEQEKRLAGFALGKHFGQFIAHPLARD